MSGFADRFYWARHRAGLGAPTIAEEAGCAQALISNIEKGEGAKGSKFNDAFARLFRVDAEWLRNGGGKTPHGFSAAEARRMRLGGSPRGARVISLAQLSPRWAEHAARAVGTNAPQADAIQIGIMTDLQEYARLVGWPRTKILLDVLKCIAALADVEKPTEATRSG
jgi:hypothetical protein